MLEALSSLRPKKSRDFPALELSEKAEKRLSLRQAVFSPSEWISTDKAEGRICASPAVSCPPAVPVAVSGEVITKSAADIFSAYGIDRIRVVSE